MTIEVARNPWRILSHRHSFMTLKVFIIKCVLILMFHWLMLLNVISFKYLKAHLFNLGNKYTTVNVGR